MIKKMSKHFAIAAIATASIQANAAVLPTFTNGGFEGYTGDTNRHNGIVPPGWTTTGGTPDTFDGNTNFGNYTWAPSSTGGDFLHGIGTLGGWTESAQQVALTGLVVGQRYEISFEQAISRSDWSETGGTWQITFGAETQISEMMAIPDFGVFGGWEWQTMIFTATSTSQTLTVTATSDTQGLRADLGIDSFFLGDPGSNPDNPTTPPSSNVPEPTTLALLMLSWLGLAVTRRRS